MAYALLDGILKYSSIETSNNQKETTKETEKTSLQLISPTLTLDILGSIQQIRGFIENGETFVRLTELTNALGFVATWDAQRHIPVIMNGRKDNNGSF
jgi:hypothetical protein